MESGALAKIGPAVSEMLKEQPPPSLATITKRVGLRELRTLLSHCPDLMGRVAERRRFFGQFQQEQRRAALENALVENPAPAMKQVGALR